jgi:hypothetical protein
MASFEGSAGSMPPLPPLDDFFRSEWTDEQFRKYYDQILSGPFSGYEDMYGYQQNPPPPALPIIEKAVVSWVEPFPQSNQNPAGDGSHLRKGQLTSNCNTISEIMRHPDQIDLRCLRPLWTGLYKWSQVWEGTIGRRIEQSPSESFPVVGRRL